MAEQPLRYNQRTPVSELIDKHTTYLRDQLERANVLAQFHRKFSDHMRARFEVCRRWAAAWKRAAKDARAEVRWYAKMFREG